MKIKVLNRVFTNDLLLWHLKENKRQMPWKGEKNPYKIWLSEIILQQTRVEQGWQYYQKFVKNYPTILMLANAKEDEVYKLWEGLGYYSRCRNLIATAKYIAFECDGVFPEKYEDIVKLKGVGPYTAAAIASFAFNAAYAVVDGNVTRVLARYFGITKAIDSTEGKKIFAALAQDLLDKTKPALYNQAIMDFGATVCKPLQPLCTGCLLQTNCKALAKDKVKEWPVKEKKILKTQRRFYFIIAEYKAAIYITKRSAKDIWHNLHQFILIETNSKVPVSVLLTSREFINIFKEKYTVLDISDFYKQQLTHQSIDGCFIHLKLQKKLDIKGYSLLSKKTVAQLAFPKFINSYLHNSKLLLPS